MRTTLYRHNNTHVLYNQTVFSNFPEDLFSRHASSSESAASSSQGRGTVVFFEHDQTHLVLKRYHRGGLLGRLVKSTYIFNGLSRTRMWREFELLAAMRKLGLPVPRPVAVRCECRYMFCYQGQIIAERVTNSRTLTEILRSENLSEKTWEAIGMVIRQFHHHLIEHGDLNASNILLDNQGQIFLIDFDKSIMHKSGDERWCTGNLNRLRRSLTKWKSQHPGFHFEALHWDAFEKGYKGARDAPLQASTAADAAR